MNDKTTVITIDIENVFYKIKYHFISYCQKNWSRRQSHVRKVSYGKLKTSSHGGKLSFSKIRSKPEVSALTFCSAWCVLDIQKKKKKEMNLTLCLDEIPYNQ